MSIFLANIAGASMPASAGGGGGSHTFLDTDAEAFDTAVGGLTTVQQAAIDDLVIDLKAASLWAKLTAAYPFVGGTSTKHSYNLKNPAQYQITWAGTITHDSNGVTGDGSTGWGDTGLNCNTVLTQYDTHLSVYSRDSAQINGFELGAFNSDASSRFVLACRQSVNTAIAYLYTSSGFGEMNGSAADGSGLFTATIRSISDRELYRNATSLQTRSGSTASSLPDETLGVLAYNRDSGAASFTSRNIAWASVGSGLSDANVSALHTCVSDYQTALSRNV